MPNDIVIFPGSDTELAKLSSSDLRAELVRSLSLSVEHLTRAASIVRLLEERGEAVEDEANKSLVSWLRRIAYGQLAPEAVIRFSGKPSLINQISSLPLPDQRRVASGQPVSLVVRRGSGGFDSRLIDPLYMSPSQFTQVFARGRIRDEAEQIAFLEAGPVESDTKKPSKVGRLRPDTKRAGLVIGRTFAPVADILGALALLHPGLPPDEVDEPVVISLKLSPLEAKRFRMQAARSNISAPLLAYRAVMSLGLLAPIEGE
jgi:hypothetical protein